MKDLFKSLNIFSKNPIEKKSSDDKTKTTALNKVNNDELKLDQTVSLDRIDIYDGDLYNNVIDNNKICLIKELSMLKESSKEAIEGLGEFTSFKKYMHIERDVQKELESIIINANKINEAQLILVCGSVGDGKSHIISYFKNKFPDIMNNFTLHNDATESLDPDKTSMDTLNIVLDNFSDEKLENSNQKMILAINLGTLNNFIDSNYGDRFSLLKNYVSEKKILETGIEENSFDVGSRFQFINFSDYHIFTLKDEKIKSNYIISLIKKLTEPNEFNIFYKSYINSCVKCSLSSSCPIKANFELLSNESLQQSIVDLLVQCIIKNKIIITTRALINFMYDLIVPRLNIDINSPMYKNNIANLNNIQYMQSLMPNIIFCHKELSFIFESLSTLDPLNVRNQKVDDFILEFNNSNSVMSYFKDYIDYPKGYIDKIIDIDIIETQDRGLRKELLKLFIRSYYLCGKEEIFSLNDVTYENYIEGLYFYNKGDKRKLIKLYEDVKNGITKWNGETGKDRINIFIGKNQTKYKVSEEIDLKADTSNLPISEEDDELIKFVTTLELGYKSEKSALTYKIDIDFSLYKLLVQVNNGYRPNKKDKNTFINFVEFINKLEESGSQREMLIFTEKNREVNKSYKLEYDSAFEFYRFVEK